MQNHYAGVCMSVARRVVQAKGQPFCGLTSQSQSTMSPCFASTVSGKQTDVLLLLEVWEKLFLGLKKNSVGVAMSSHHTAKLSFPFSACKTRHTYKTPSSVWSHPQDESLGEYVFPNMTNLKKWDPTTRCVLFIRHVKKWTKCPSIIN